MTRVGLVNLTPEQLELLSALAERPDFEVVGAVHADPTSTPFKIAQVFAIPTETEPEALRQQHPELVVVPDGCEDLRRQIRALGLAPEILTTRETVSRYGLAVDLGPSRTAAGSTPASAPPTREQRRPNLEVMLRDGIDDFLGGDGDMIPRLKRLAAGWAQLLGADACAIWVEDPVKVAELGWVIAGPRAELAPVPDAVARAVLGGGGAPGAPSSAAAPEIYVRYEGRPESSSQAPHRALAAFPLEAVRGVVWFHDLRLPARELDDRVMAIRRAARRLGRLLGLEGRVESLLRAEAHHVHIADLLAAMAAAPSRDAVVESLSEALVSQLHPELAVMRLPGAADPELLNSLRPPLDDHLGTLLAIEEELAHASRAALRAQRQPAVRVDDRLVAGLAVPMRHGVQVLGTVTVFRSIAAGGPAREAETQLWSEEEQRFLERLLLHASASLALIAAGEAGASGADDVLDRRGLAALLRAEVRRYERYTVPFLLTILDVEAPPEHPDAGAEIAAHLARRLRSRLRATDALAVLGRRRVAVLNPHANRAGGGVVPRVQEVLAELEAEVPGAATMRLRANQIHFPADVSSLDDLLARLG